MWKHILFASLIFIVSLTAYILKGEVFAKGKICAGTIDIKVNIPARAGEHVRLWLPYPLSDECQTIDSVAVSANTPDVKTYKDEAKGISYLYAVWKDGSASRTLQLKFAVKGYERKAALRDEKKHIIPADVKKYLERDKYITTDDRVKEIAWQITHDEKGVLSKARAVYDWVIMNTSRDQTIKGCGTGEVERILAKRSGKCVDISSVFIALARASGVPAREVFGIRLPDKGNKDISGDFHCWAEFYLPGSGWVPVDPADVRKIMPGENLDLQGAKKHMDYYFGSVDQNRMVLGRGGREVVFNPAQKAGALNYFMYPYAEVNGKALDYLDPKSFSYSIRFESNKE